MLERVRDLPGQTLRKDDYSKEFRSTWPRIEDFFWKLERIQTFREPGDDSWEAWLAGDWDKALALHESDRQALVEYYERATELGIEARRVRVIEYPINPYLQWELNAFRVRAEAGERIRVLDATKLGDLEATGQLPELTILGTRVLFQLVYDERGTPNFARKLVDPEVIQACRAEVAQLFEQAEDLLPFFEREVANLPPPIPDRI